MEHIAWNNNTKSRIIIDIWTDGEYSYAIILYPSNILHLQWVKINKEER